MPIGVQSDFTLYQEQFHGGFTEVVAQQTDIFNAASRGGIVLENKDILGQYGQETFYTEIAGLVTRRDPLVTSTPVPLAMGDAENVSVKIDRKIGPVQQTDDSFRKKGKDPREMSFVLGQQGGAAFVADQVTAVVRSLVAAINTTTANVANVTGTLTHADLSTGLQLMGDSRSKIVAWIMHSTAYGQLERQGIVDNVFQVGHLSIMGGTPGTFGRPVIVLDEASLLNTTPTPDEYSTIGLSIGAATVTNSQVTNLLVDKVSGLENIVTSYQADLAYNLRMKGYQWDITNGGANPIDAALDTSTNWDQVATDAKNCAGIIVESDIT